MADLKFDLDIESIVNQFKNIKESITKDLTVGVEALSRMTHAKTLELARDELGSLSQTYMDNLEYDNPEKNIWVVTLKAPAMWIEEGRKAGFMQELLNGKSSKTSKDGKKYAVIPFKQNKNPSQQSPKANELAGQIKQALKSKGVNWKKIERDESGSPRIGKLHTFNFETARAKPEHKTPLTYGVSVYQNQVKGGGVSRDVMTFRIIHEDHKQEGLWNHPGRKGSKLLDKAFDWAMEAWEKDILPDILKDYNK
jgi:hypothetical protein